MSSFVPVYTRRPSPLHTARAAVAFAYCASLAGIALLFWPSPLLTGAALGAVATAALGAGVWRELAGAARAAFWFALLVTAINVVVSERGATVLFRAGTVLGHRFDLTLESLAWGAMTGLSLVCLSLAFLLYATVVDPDEMLRVIGRRSHRSALTASLATRLVPVLARDARRHAEAARCRPRPPERFLLARATLAGALERAVDVAAALEVRGYALARPPRRARRPLSRHDARFGTAAAVVVSAAIVAKLTGTGAVRADPTVYIGAGRRELVLAGIVLAAGVLPFAGAGARLGVGRG